MDVKLKTLLADAEAYADSAGSAAMKSRDNDQKYQWLIGIANIITELIVEIEKAHLVVKKDELYEMLVNKLDFGSDDLSAGMITIDFLENQGLLKNLTNKPLEEREEQEAEDIKTSQGESEQRIHAKTFRNFTKFITEAIPDSMQGKHHYFSPVYSDPDDLTSQNIEGYLAEWVVAPTHILTIEAENDDTVFVYSHDFANDTNYVREISFTDNPNLEQEIEEAAKFCREWLQKHVV